MNRASHDPAAIGRAARVAVAAELARVGYEPSCADLLQRVEIFAAELARWGSKLNLTAAPEDPTEIAFHVIDSLAPLLLAQPAGHPMLAEAFVSGVHLLDLGSGAGFPGLILASACEAEFVLLEARRKRASFLSVTAAAIGLTNVRVEASRADSLLLEPVYDIVTARAFGEPATVCKTAAMALRPGGRVMLYAGPSQRRAIEAACIGRFEPPTLLEYAVTRGGTSVAHMLAIAHCR